jgi:hypothetical protein
MATTVTCVVDDSARGTALCQGATGIVEHRPKESRGKIPGTAPEIDALNGASRIRHNQYQCCPGAYTPFPAH